MIFSMMNVIQSGGVGWAQRYEITRCQERKTWPSWVATSPGDSTAQPASSIWPHTRLHELLPRDHRQLRQRVPEALVARGAVLAGIDSHNIDDTRTRSRPVHTILLGAQIPIVEHMTGLAQLPDQAMLTLKPRPPRSSWPTIKRRAAF